MNNKFLNILVAIFSTSCIISPLPAMEKEKTKLTLKRPALTIMEHGSKKVKSENERDIAPENLSNSLMMEVEETGLALKQGVLTIREHNSNRIKNANVKGDSQTKSRNSSAMEVEETELTLKRPALKIMEHDLKRAKNQNVKDVPQTNSSKTTLKISIGRAAGPQNMKMEKNFLLNFHGNYLPKEVIDLIWYYHHSNHPENTNTNFASVCKDWQTSSENYFEALNKVFSYVTFDGCSQTLSQRLIYMVNHRLKTLIAMFRNVILKRSEDIDRANFQKLGMLFVGTRMEKPNDKKKEVGLPFFGNEHTLKKFVHLLMSHVDGHYPTSHQMGAQKANKAKATKIRNELTNILALHCNTGNVQNAQNEIILNYCIRKFINQEMSSFAEEPLFLKLTSALVDVVLFHDELSNLRVIDAKDSSAWKRIIEIDFGATLTDLRTAALCHFHAGLFSDAAAFIKQVIEKAGKDVTAEDLFQASYGHTAAKLYPEAAAYAKQAIEKAGKDVTTEDLFQVSYAHRDAKLFLEAAAYAKQAIEKAGEDVPILFLYDAAFTHDRVQLLAEAASYLRQAVEKVGTDDVARELLRVARDRFNIERFEEADRCYQYFNALIP